MQHKIPDEATILSYLHRGFLFLIALLNIKTQLFRTIFNIISKKRKNAKNLFSTYCDKSVKTLKFGARI